MTVKKELPRGVALAAGTFVLVINGIIYAWSIYSSPFSSGFGWTSAQLGLCFTVIMAGFCLGGILGSGISSGGGAGLTMIVGGALGALGFVLCFFLTANTLWLLYLAFAISSLGVGAVYNAVISTVVMRFPDKKGTASGVLMMGFGASSLIMGTLASKLIGSPDFGWHLTYVLTGALLFAAAVVGRVLVAPVSVDTQTQGRVDEGMTSSRMVRTPQFALLFCIGMLGCAFGSGIIGHCRYIVLEAGAPEELAALSVGLVSVFNGLGRIVFGTLHDKKGLRWSFGGSTALFIIAGVVATLSLRAGALWPLMCAMMLVGLAYGCIPPVNSSLVGELFGRRHFASNLSVANLSILPAAFASTAAGAIQTTTGSYAGAFALFGALELVAVVLIVMLGRRVDKMKEGK